MAPKEIFAAREHRDKNEGKGGSRIIGWFATSEAAQRVSDGLEGVWGTPNDLSLSNQRYYTIALKNIPVLALPMKQSV